ncbi:MAG: phosphoribosylglycinamide formyltransferase [Hyphomicrobiaceae bacterium]|nr:phosphoribosylglycinamide formyltransferase [Hyphomicrobiaceae bacterium]MCC0009050.1 phosphoribosylglycinamide formyltransferase [Hyphomicrobiaceae bacterium]
MSSKKRIGILISGRGSNMASLIEAAHAHDYPAEIVTVISNRPTAGGLAIARDAGIPTVVIDHKDFATRMAFEAKMHQALLDAGVELICSAGFMRMLTGGFVDRWRNRQLNIHPSLLPAYPGLDTHARALRDGVRIHGCTVHFVRLEMDTGPIIAQAGVAVLPGDTPETLAARVLDAEHRLYPHALRLVASGAVRVTNDILETAPPTDTPAALFSPPLRP